jgi:hypothetical protein
MGLDDCRQISVLAIQSLQYPQCTDRAWSELHIPCEAGPSIELIATTTLQTSQGHPNFKKEQVETLFAQLQQKLGGAKQRRAAIAAEYEMLGLE